MSLRGKLLAKDLALVLGVGSLVVVSLHHLKQQRAHVNASLNEYAALRLVGSAQVRLTRQARHLAVMSAPTRDAPPWTPLPWTPLPWLSDWSAHLEGKSFNARQSTAEFQRAIDDLQKYRDMIMRYQSILPPEIPFRQRLDARTRTTRVMSQAVRLRDAIASWGSHGAAADSEAKATWAALLENASALSQELAELGALCDGFINETQLASAADLRSSIVSAVILAGAILLLAVVLSFWQYRRIMAPLLSLRQWSRRIAERDFSSAYRPSRDREFRELGEDVNKMAGDLNDFCTRLETMVTVKSKELVRSERLGV